MDENPFRSKKGIELYSKFFGSRVYDNSRRYSQKNTGVTGLFGQLPDEIEETGNGGEDKNLEQEVIRSSEKNGTSQIQTQIETNFSLTLEHLLQYYKHQGVVGEERNVILQTLCAINGLSFGVEGYSGSGKTFVVDNLIALLPEDEIYQVGLSSDLAILNDATKINEKRFIYIPEIQKAMRKKDAPIIEVIKNLTEGKDAERIVTKEQGKTVNYKIKAGITVIYTLAIENDFKKDDETSRRFVRLFTDSSEEHIEDILNYKAQSRYLTQDDVVSPKNIGGLKIHLYDCININFDFKDPFALYMNEYIPFTPKTIGFINHYYTLLNASAKFHHKNRVSDGQNLFLNIEDHFLIHTLYHEEFCNTISELNKNGDYTELIEKSKSKVNWEECWKNGLKIMEEKFPKVVEEWKLKNQGVDGVKVHNPLTKNKEVLLDQIRYFPIIRVGD